ncbi:MAG TPA: BTAD domain-containing putative transcriptional regulator [Anaerolineae bacterium]|nr:BTAD domain-containing putative transcriptional regulator [Anaerolineae bacterium]
MAVSIIPTKITIPRRASGVIQRARLIDYLHENLGRKLMLVTAPAGYGKTTLLVDFANDVNLPVCWYTLDEGDRDPATFLAYLIAAFRQMYPQFGERTQPLAEHGAPSAHAAAAALVADMVAAIPDYFVLILDDWHLVSEEAPIIELIDQLLRYLPEHAHIIVAGRTLLRGPLVRLAAQGAVAGLGAGDLRFTADEVREVLAAKYRLQITPEQASQLAEESEGWITAIVLTSQNVWQNFLAGLVRARDSAGTVFEYLAGEVFDRLPPALREFLCDSAILRQFTAALCDDLRQRQDAQDWIEQVETRNLFLTRIDAQGVTWFRYHHLFSDFLVARFKRDDFDRYTSLHRRAGEWFEVHQQPEEAVDHFWQANAVEQAAHVMNDSARDLFMAGRTQTLARWATLLPPTLRHKAPELILFQAQVLGSRGQLSDALDLLHNVQQAFDEQQNQLGKARAKLVAGWAYHAAAQLADALRAGQEAAQDLEVIGLISDTFYAQAMRLIGCAHSGMGLWQEAESFLARALTLYRSFPVDERRSVNLALTLQDLANALRPMGRLEEAAMLQSEALELLRRIGNPLLLAHCLNNVGYDRQVSGNYEGALSMYVEALMKAEEVEDRRLQSMILDGMAATYRDRGEFDRAMETYARVFSLTGLIADQLLVSWALDGLGHTHRLANELDRAVALFEQARSIAVREGLESQVNLSTASIGITRIEQGDVRGLEDLERIAGLLRQGNAYLDLGRVLLWLAYAQQVAGQIDRAKATLIEMARHGRRLGCRPFSLAEGRRLLALLTWGSEQLLQEVQLRSWVTHLTEKPGPVARTLAQTAQLPRLEVRAFGPGQIWRDGELLTTAHWGRSANARELFFYLLEHSPSRKEDIGLNFWPELSMARMTSSFHAAKYRARRALGMEFVVYDDEHYRINSLLPLIYDVAEFRQQVEASRQATTEVERAEHLRSAVQLYGGDYLSDVDADWAVATRASLHQQYFEVLSSLVRIALHQHCHDEVIDLCQRGLEIDYFHENLHRALMVSLAATGHATGALRHYEVVVKRLAQELKTTPTTEMASLAARIRAGEPLDFSSLV